MFLEKSKRLAIVDFDGSKVDYDKMVDNVKYFSRIVYKDICENNFVLIISENRIEWIYSFFAIWDRLSTPIAIDALSSEEEILYFLNDTKPKAVIATNKTIENVKLAVNNCDFDINMYNLDEINLEEYSDDEVLRNPKDEDIAVMIYTSGTTGNPKGIMLTYSNIIGEIQAIQSFGITFDDEQVIAILPYHHILPLMTTCLYIFYSGNKYSAVLVPKLTSQEILKRFKTNNITLMSAVPRVYKLFYKSIKDKINASIVARVIYAIAKKINNRTFSRIIFKKVHDNFGGKLRTLVAGGAKSDIEMIEFFNVLGFNYAEGFGLSETAPVIAGNIYPKYKIGTVGLVVSNAEVKTVNGELWVKGPMVMKGYYNNPEKTAEVMTVDGWFKTGDLAQIDEDGYITIIGRANSMIVLSNGKNIDPEKLENKFVNMSNGLVEEVGIFGKNDKLSALIVPNMQYIKDNKINNISTHIKDLVEFYNTDVHNYEKILDYKITEQELPKTRVGKLRRFMLPELFSGQLEKREIINEPDTKEYKILKEYIKKLKGNEPGPDENFEVEVGLDSLDQVEFLTYIENSFSLKLDETTLLKYSTLRLLAEYISEKSISFTDSEIKMDNIIKNAPHKEVKLGYLQWLLFPLVWILFKIYFRFSIKNNNKIKDEPTIFIANHESFIDALILSLALPFKIHNKTFYLALEKYFSNPFMKYIARNGNIINVNIEKNIKQSVEEISNVLKQGNNVFIFPEGTRTKNGKLSQFKKIFAMISKELNVDIQCIGIEGAYEAYSRFSKFPKPKKITIEALDRVSPQGKTYDTIVEESYNIFLEYKKRVKPEKYLED
ncbi:AMP-binding protein [Caviibacter abscessus]|uniref:AMP-binding protein n=1 Tax=Caviibacter abscessus TaxID=1766719 RepID=UPI000830273D|nr:AMP-binding protein [Caviibacter abscessus]